MIKTSRQLTLIITCLGSVSLAAHDTQWKENHDRSDLLGNLESLKEAQNALLNLDFFTITKGRQFVDSNGDDFSPTINMSKERFQNMVAKINSEVSLLRNQALVLSKAYKDLMVKHKSALKQIDTLQVINPISENPPTTDSQQPEPVTISSSVQLPKPTPTCNCNCMEQSGGLYVFGNNYYYYNVYPGQEGVSNVPRPPWQPQQPASPSAPSYHQPPPSHHINQRPSHPDEDDPDGFLAFKPRPTSSKFDLNLHRTEQTQHKDKVSWKQKFFDQHDLQAVEKLFSDSETKALTEQWAKMNHGRRVPKMEED